MDTSPRQEHILRLLRSSGEVTVDGLAAELDVATQTVRRDLNTLSDLGLAQRTHGGARRPATVSNFGYEDRRRQASAAKVAIGKAAAALVPDNSSIALNIGTTTEEVAAALSAHHGLVVVSNNINVLQRLNTKNTRELILAGGTVRPEDGAIIGPDTVDFFGRYKVDIAIIGASAIDCDGAVMDFDAREVAVTRAIIQNARKTILVCDHSKFSRTAPVRISGLEPISTLVTNVSPSATFCTQAKAHNCEVILTGAPPQNPSEST